MAQIDKTKAASANRGMLDGVRRCQPVDVGRPVLDMLLHSL